MRGEEDRTDTRIAYEKPSAIDIGPAAPVVGASCVDGQEVAAGACGPAGNAASGTCASQGLSAGGSCSEGSAAGTCCGVSGHD